MERPRIHWGRGRVGTRVMRISELQRGVMFLGAILLISLFLRVGTDAGDMSAKAVGTNAPLAKRESKGRGVSSRHPPERAPGFELQDQFDNVVKFGFPRSTPTVLTVADRAGSKQVDGWVAALTKHFPRGLAVEGLADLSAAPGWLRGSIRKQFRADLPHPVMLDWEGHVARSFQYEPGSVNVYLIDRSGRIVYWTYGIVETKALDELIVKTHAILNPEPEPDSEAASGTGRGSKTEEHR